PRNAIDDSGAHQCPCVNGRTPSATRASSPAPGPCPTLPVAIATAHSPVTNAAVNGARRSHEQPYRGACRHHFRAARGDGCWDCRPSSTPRVGPLTPGPRIHIRRGTNTTPPGAVSPLTTARPSGGPSTIVSHVASRQGPARGRPPSRRTPACPRCRAAVQRRLSAVRRRYGVGTASVRRHITVVRRPAHSPRDTHQQLIGGHRYLRRTAHARLPNGSNSAIDEGQLERTGDPTGYPVARHQTQPPVWGRVRPERGRGSHATIAHRARCCA